MKIQRVLNNNVVVALDRDGQEIIGMGKGIGFQKKSGDIVRDTLIEKIFKLEGSEQKKQFSDLMQNIDPNAAIISEKTISYSLKNYPMLKLSDSIHITLTDHINGVLERQKMSITLNNAIWTEIRRAYPDEFDCGMYAVKLLNEKYGYELSEDEAAFVAVHIVNAGRAGSTDIEKVAKIVKEITVMTETFFRGKIDERSIDFYRFSSHVKSIAYAVADGKPSECAKSDIYEFVKDKYPEISRCADKICGMMKLKYKYTVSDEDKAYLILYTERLVRNK